MLTNAEVEAIRDREQARCGPGYRVDVSRYTGAVCVVQHPVANADEPETPMSAPVLTFDPPGEEEAAAAAAKAADEAPLTPPTMDFGVLGRLNCPPC